MAFTWTPDLADPEIFHITHVGNLASIIASGGLLSDSRVAAGQVRPTTIGSPSIKSRRLTWHLNLTDRPCVGDFVPFYFCPRSVMLYLVRKGHLGWQGGQREVVHLVTRVSTLKGLSTRCVFTDRNAATSYHGAFENLALLGSAIDWQVMPLEVWTGEAKEPRQAEFLVHHFVPWTAISKIVAMTPATALRAGTALEGATVPAVAVEPSWYYP